MRRRSPVVSAVIWAWFLFSALPALVGVALAALLIFLERYPPN